jgi:hypothetical protein
MKFKEFCLTKATTSPFNITDVEINIPERYKTPTESMIEIMKNKIEILDKINIPFIESAFDQNYVTILKEKLPDGEVPEGIIIRLSDGLYGCHPSKLNEVDGAIIKVLTTYICIQN